jgi:hypothetical protein
MLEIFCLNFTESISFNSDFFKRKLKESNLTELALKAVLDMICSKLFFLMD